LAFFTFQLPDFVSKQLSTDANHEIGTWPSIKRTYRIPPFMELLLNTDQQFVDAARILQKADTEPDAGAKALEQYLWSIKQLVFDLVQMREKAVAERLEKVRQLTPADRAQLQHALSDTHFYEAVASMQQRWLPELASEMKKHADGGKLKDKFESPSDEEAETLKTETWFVNDRDLSLRFHARAHADSLLKAWLDVCAKNADAANSPDAGESQLFKYGLEAGEKPEATGGCFKCHTLDRIQNSGLVINWDARDPQTLSRGFTEFSHRPHLMVTSAQCQSCHRMQEGLDFSQKDFVTSSGLPSDNPDCTFTSGFNAIAKSDCAGCHTKRAAGDNCVQCHNYHVGHLFTRTAERVKVDKQGK